MKKDEDEGIMLGKSVGDAKPAKVSDLPPEVQEPLRSGIFAWRLRQFFWGWSWCAAFDIFTRHIIAGDGTFWWCLLFAFQCGMGHYLGRYLRIPVYVVKR